MSKPDPKEKRIRRKVIAEVIEWIERESDGLHVREGNDESGLLRAIRVIRENERKKA